MKKLFLSLLLVSVTAFGAQQIITQDPAESANKRKVSPIVISSGVVITTNSVAAVAVVGVQSSAGGADAAKIPKLNSSGVIDGSMLANTPTNIMMQLAPRDIAMSTSYVWTHCTNITTTATNGLVYVKGSIACAPNGSYLWVRIRDNVGTTNIIGFAESTSSAAGANLVAQPDGWDTLSGSTKTYYMDVAWANGTGTMSITNGPILSGNLPVHGTSGNSMMQLVEFPK